MENILFVFVAGDDNIHYDPKTVAVAIDSNDWKPIPMVQARLVTKTQNSKENNHNDEKKVFAKSLPFYTGKSYSYKFIVDGDWMLSEKLAGTTAKDNNGNVNHVFSIPHKTEISIVQPERNDEYRFAKNLYTTSPIIEPSHTPSIPNSSTDSFSTPIPLDRVDDEIIEEVEDGEIDKTQIKIPYDNRKYKNTVSHNPNNLNNPNLNDNQQTPKSIRVYQVLALLAIPLISLYFFIG